MCLLRKVPQRFKNFDLFLNITVLTYLFCVLQGANPDLQDTNGNTVTHMMVIYDKMVSIGLIVLRCSPLLRDGVLCAG